MERLTSEQIRLLEELRELRDSGILTVDEFELQVAKVLGRPQAVEPSPVDEEPVVPDETAVEEISDEVVRAEQDVVNGVPTASDETHESELLEYEFVEPNVSDEEEILAEENQDVEPSTISDSPALPIADMGSEQNKSGRRKILVGTTVSLALVAVGTLVALIGGGKGDTTSTQIVGSTTTVTENASTERTDAPTSIGNAQAPATSSQSGATTTAVFPNAASGNAGRPTTATTPITTPLTTVADSDSRLPIVTSLQVSKSHSVFYNNPYPVPQTATFTASIVNDEQVEPMLILVKGPPGYSLSHAFDRVRPGTWKAKMSFFWADGRTTALVGLYEWCVALRNNERQCAGPSVSFEVLEVDRNPPTLSDVTISPAVVYAGDTVRVSARIEHNQEVTDVRTEFLIEAFQLMSANCTPPNLTSGDRRDGIWSTDCTIADQCATYWGSINIRASGEYTPYGDLTYRLQVLASC